MRILPRLQALDELLKTLEIGIEAVSVQQACLARRVCDLNCKGIHAAGLNDGDCFALGKTLGQPLLCKGNDFSRTDVDAVPRGGDKSV